MVNKKLTRYIEDAEKTEKKIADLQQHLKDVRAKQRRFEDQEIVRSIRELGLSDRGLVQVLEAIQDGRISLNVEDLPPVEAVDSDRDDSGAQTDAKERKENRNDFGKADLADDSTESAADDADLANDSTESEAGRTDSAGASAESVMDGAGGADSVPEDESENMERQVQNTAPESEDTI